MDLKVLAGGVLCGRGVVCIDMVGVLEGAVVGVPSLYLRRACVALCCSCMAA